MVPKVLIKLAATWEGIAAMKELEAEAKSARLIAGKQRGLNVLHQHLESSLCRASLAT